jgi:hypothetical protein
MSDTKESTAIKQSEHVGPGIPEPILRTLDKRPNHKTIDLRSEKDRRAMAIIQERGYLRQRRAKS